MTVNYKKESNAGRKGIIKRFRDWWEWWSGDPDLDEHVQIWQRIYGRQNK